MQQKSKRILVAILAAVLVLALGMGLLFVFLPNGMQNSDIVAELSEDDFEFKYVSSLAYSSGTEETSGKNDVYGWGYKPDKSNADYAYITSIKNEKLTSLQSSGVTKLVINIPAEHGEVPVAYVEQDAFEKCSLSIVDINMPLSVYWQIKGNSRFTFDNNSSFARADGLTATFTKFTPSSGSGITTLILPSNVWIDEDSDGKMENSEPKYRYTEYLFKGDKSAPYTNLVVMPDVVNIFNGTAEESNSDRPKMQGGLLSKSEKLKSVFFCTGRSEVLHLYPLTFENCTALKEISLSAGVYLEDGARVFQGSSALEKFSIADEKTASAPLFYMVGADGALYTNNYSYSYYTQSSTERYYEWWKNGSLPLTGNFKSEWVPTKVWDSESKVSELPISEPSDPSQKGTFAGDKSAISTTAKNYYATKEYGGKYDSGVGIPEGSYVFDVNGTDKNGTEDNDNDFATGTEAGQYDTEADFQSATLTTAQNGNKGGTTASISVDGGSITVTEKEGGNQSTVTVTINGVEYKSRMQFKQGSNRYLEIKVPFTFDITAYFAGGYTAVQAGTESYPQMALFSSSNFKTGDYKGNVKDKAKTAKTENAITKLADVATTSLSGADHILKIENGQLKEGTYYIAQPADDMSGTSGSAQMLFLVITPSQVQAPSSIVVEQNVSLETSIPDWQRIPNDALIFQKIKDTSYFLDLRYPIVRYDKTCEIPFRVKVLSSAGEPLLSQDIEWKIMDVNGQDVSNYLYMQSPAENADKEGYFNFSLKLDEIFSDSEFYGEGQHKQGKNFAVKFTAGEVTKYIFINLLPEAGNKDIPDVDKFDEDVKPRYLNLVEENASRYQTLISMPAKAKNDKDEYINSFDFSYHETVEIGPNAFQNTYITVIRIPDRIAKIGASAFRFSDHLQTVYLPDDADIGLNAFGQEADASPQDGTVYTAGKNNFFLIAPSRTSFEHYLIYAGNHDDDSGLKELQDPNYNVFPVHAEKETQGFQDWGGKDASYDYTPYLTYEITVNFLKYDASGETLQSTETRTFLYGMDARYVKATATTEWAKFDDKYNNNAPVWFGRIQDGDGSKTVQQINTISTEITWSVAADGWYYDEKAALPAGDWYFGKQSVTSSEDATERAKEFTDFIGGWAGGHVSSNDIRNLVQAHYTAVHDMTSDVQGITQTGGEPTDLRQPVDNYSYDYDDPYYTTEFDAKTRWNRWYLDQKLNNDDGAIVQRFFTMPFSITLKSKEEERESRIEYDVPTFQNIGEITYGEDTIKAAPEDARDDTWNVPMLTVTFDYNGFPMSRIFENFNSSAMQVKYEAWRRWYNDKAWRWDVDSGSAKWTEDNWTAMRANVNGDTVPYDAGYYRITLSFDGDGSGGYIYYWSGIYNGMRVDANADSKTSFTFILNIQPRKVPLSHVYTMQYSGLGFSLFEDNPYIDVVSYGAWSSRADYTAEGLPCAVGRYNIKLRLHDPKYPNPNDGSWTEDINKYTPNLEWVGVTGYEKDKIFSDNEVNNGRLNRWIDENGVELFILDGETEVKWGSLYTEDQDDVEIPITLTGPLATFGSEVLTYTYTGAPISLEEVFGGVFSSSSIEYTIERDGKSVTEIKNAGTYKVSITPAEGYVWWKGVPSNSDSKAGFHMEKWSLDDFWAEKGGYEEHKRDTLTFEVFVDKRIVTIPRDSYVPKEAEPPYEFEVPIGGDYEVIGYHEHDFETGAIPKAGENSAWSKTIFKQGVYDVLIRLTDPANTTWASTAGESHGDNYYIVARLYAGFDREKDYPTFKADLGDTTGDHASGDKWVELTHTYDGEEYGLKGGNDLFQTADARPTNREAIYTIYKFSEKPSSVEQFALLGEAVETIGDAGWYGISVILNDPFLYRSTTETEAYYLVHIEKAEITATFTLSNGGKATYDGSDQLTEFNDDTISFTTVYDNLTLGKDYTVIVAEPAGAAQMTAAGEYTVKVELTSSAVASNYELTDGQTEYTIDPRPLNLDLGTITGHTYLGDLPEKWYEKETLTYQGVTEGAVIAGDELKLSYQFKRDGETFPTLSPLSEAGDYTVEVLCGNPNYKVTLDETHYTIAPLTLTLDEIASVIYDKQEHKPNISFIGAKMVLVEDRDYELSYVAAGSGATLGTEDLPLTAGSYTVTVKLLSKNYTFDGNQTSKDVTFTIEKATLPAPYLSFTSFQYSGDDVREKVKAALRNFNEDMMEVAFYNNEEGTGDTLSEVKETGTYSVKVTLKDDNYKWEDETDPCLTFTVSSTAYDMSGVTFESKTFTYDGQKHSLSVQGLPEGVTVVYTSDYSGTEFVDVGEYIITATFTLAEGETRYETPKPMTAKLTITPKTIVVEWEEKNYTYTGSELDKPKAKAHGVGEDGDITLEVTLKTLADAFQNAGDYTFEAAFGSDFLKSENYTLVKTEQKYSVAKATLSAPVLGETFTYTGSDLKAAIEEAFHYESAHMSVSFYADAAAMVDPLGEIVNAGTYFAKFTLTDSDNYTWGQTEDMVVTVTVAKRSIAPTLTAADVTATYGETGNALRPSVSGIPDGYEVTYVYTYAGTNGTVYESSADAPVNVGNYTVTVKALFVGNENDEAFTVSATATLTIKAPEIGLKDPASVTYNGKEQQPNISFTDLPENIVLVVNSDYTVSYKADEGAKLGDSSLPLTAGSYTVTVTLVSGNYTFADGKNSATVTFTIEKATLPTPYLSSTSFAYTGENLSASVLDALMNYSEDTMKIAFCKTDDGAGGDLSEVTEAGTYYVKVTLTDLGYQWKEGEIEVYLPFTVVRRTPTSFNLKADDVNATYGDTGAALQPHVSGVPANYDVSYLYTYEGSGGTDYERSSVAPVNVGTYLVTVTAVYEGSVNDEPFTVSATATLTISARTIEMTLDPANVSYNGKEQKTNISFTGLLGNVMLVEGEDYTVTYTADEGATLGTGNLPLTAGSYTVTVKLLSKNYIFADGDSMTATFTISARTIEMTLDPASVSYSGTEQQTGVSFKGLPENVTLAKDTDYTVSYKAETGAQLGETDLPLTAGKYTVTVTLLSGNYTFAGSDSATATFTIEKTILPAPYLLSTSFPYTGGDLSASVRGVLINFNEDTMNIAFYDNEEGTGNALSVVTEAGTYYVKVTFSDAGYAWEEGTEIYLKFTVIKRATTSVTITASDVELTYGEAMQYPTVTVNGDTAGYEVSYFYTYQGIEGTTYPSSLEAPVNVGTYLVTVTAVYAGGSNDESFTATATAKLTIKAREIGAKLDPESVSYNGNEQKPNISFTGLPENIMLVEGTDYTVTFTAETGAKLGGKNLPLTAGKYTVTITLLSGNYLFAEGKTGMTATFTIEKTTLSAPYLSSTSFPYTGEDLSDDVRAVLINYIEGTMKIEFCKTSDGTGDALPEVKGAGDYFLKVTLTDLGYQWEGGKIELYLSFKVAKKAVLKPSGDDTTFVYTEAEQVYAVAENPAYTVSGNKQTNANEAGYKVTVTLIDKANYEWSGGGTDDVTFLFKIQKADYDMSDVSFSDQTVSFDGKEHSIFIEGDLPEGVSANYQGNGQITVGGYHVTVSFEGDEANYNPIPSMHALLTIRYAEFDFSGITFKNVSVKYDGNAHSVYIQGELPEDVDVAYEGNEQKEPGIYTVKAIFSDVRGVIFEKTATLTVLRTRMEFVDPDGAVTIVVDSADGFDPTWELACDSVPDSIVRTAWAWEKDSFTANFTVKFVKDGEEVPFDGKLTVRLVIPQMLRDKEFTMQSMGRSASVEYTRDGDYVVFEADGLSAYVFTCEFMPYLSIVQIASGIALVSVVILIALAIVIKKNKQGE